MDSTDRALLVLLPEVEQAAEAIERVRLVVAALISRDQQPRPCTPRRLENRSKPRRCGA